MKILLAMGLFLVTVIACALPKPTLTPAPEKTYVSLEELVDSVQDAIGSAQDKLATSHLPKLKSVTLTLQTEAAKDGSATLNILILKIGGGLGSTVSQQLTLTLVPPKAGEARDVSLKGDITAALLTAIQAAAGAADHASTGRLKLQPQTLDFEFAFTITYQGQAGLKFELATVGVDVGGKKSNKAVQKIKVTFENPAPKV